MASDVKQQHTEQLIQWTYEATARLRAKLIDLSRRSSLIAFQHTPRSVSQLRIIDERPDLLFERLQQGRMGFEPVPGEEQTPADEQTPAFAIAYEHARLTDAVFLADTGPLGDTQSDARSWQDAERALRARVRAQLGLPELDYGKGQDIVTLARIHGFDPAYDLKNSDDGTITAHHTDGVIRVLLTRKELDRRLQSIADRTTSHVRETGHHTLHLIFGFIQWFEDDTSERAFHAPLLLLPVVLVKDESRPRKEYRLAIWEGGLEVNVALVEKAREHWGLDLPALQDGEAPEAYFTRVKAVLAHGQRLTLRNFVTLSVLPPMVLWRDLDPEAWPRHAFAEHRLLPGLIGAAEFKGGDGGDSITHIDHIDIDDPQHAAQVPALITDADTSQHHAIMHMAAGHDMAIEGPPGTGKSQTITNIIATALAMGKRVLFIAEKQAALRVVSDRLRAAGFGPLLLELHGDRAIRADVYAGVRERLDARPAYPQSILEDKRKELRRHRDVLRRYVSLVRTPLGNLNSTAYALAWREIRLRARFTREQIKIMEARWSPQNPLNIDQPTLWENREQLAQFGKALIAIDQGVEGRRTQWAHAERLDPFDQSGALDAATAAGHAAFGVAEHAGRLAELGISFPAPNDDPETVLAASRQLATITPLTCVDEAIVGAALHHRRDTIDILDIQQEWRMQCDHLRESVIQPETVTMDAAEALCGLLHGLRHGPLYTAHCPATLTQVRQEIGLYKRLGDQLVVATRDMDRLDGRLTYGVQTPVRHARVVVAVFAAMARVNTSTGALLSAALLDPACGDVIASARRQAATILNEREKIARIAQADAFTVEPMELDELSEILETSGVLRRLGKRYKRARRRAGQLLAGTCDRRQSGQNLRHVATFLRSCRAFSGECRARGLFPVVLWDGVNSDFATLDSAYAIASDAASRLSAVDDAKVLRWWLGADPADRMAFAAGCNRLDAILTEFSDRDFGLVSLCNLSSASAHRAESMHQLAEAADRVGMNPEALFQHCDQTTIADDLRRLHELRRAFDAFCAHTAFDWVGDVSSSLDGLRHSLAELDARLKIDGPLNLRQLLEKSQAPAALLTSIVHVSSHLTKAIAVWDHAADTLWDIAEIDTLALGEDLDWNGAASALVALGDDRVGAGLAADLLKYRSAVAARQLSAFSHAAAEGQLPPALLDDAYELRVISAILRAYFDADGRELGRLGSLSLDDARQSFRRVDKELHQLEAAAIVATRLQDTAPVGIGHGRKADYTDLRLLENEIELVRPRTSLRDVTHRAGAALQALKPVWMMSPISVAQYIRPGSLSFDLLIIDEASQMRPEFAVSCILRAEQFVVVGDAHQLPPSNHFQVARVYDHDVEEDSVGVDDSTESILDLANQRLRIKPRLKWHYRSQHESLIQFSNRQFYNQDLVIFPSPMANDDELLGVKCCYTPSFYADTVYESSINQREAELIIKQAVGLMQTYPKLSIGIVAMNAKQTELIQNEFDRICTEDKRVARYVETFANTVNEFFIKNLENVQGDERDIILISTVYGPGKDGNIRQNFGLINQDIGWRRLNVLVTRAKMSCRLITSLRPDDVKVTDTSSRGVIAFKNYLTYAHGGAHYDDVTSAETDSDFEIFVADALRAGGYEVVYQVGVETFRIDLGVRHESCPIGFIAGVECDGAPYHSGQSVRERDHIRQTILEHLGWKIYRVWSTDWFADPARETAKLLAWLDQVRSRALHEWHTRPETPIY